MTWPASRNGDRDVPVPISGGARGGTGQGTAPVLTSLSREASRCRGLSDIMNCRVVSALGAGPVFMGANWILRMIRRTEFLRGEKPSLPGTPTHRGTDTGLVFGGIPVPLVTPCNLQPAFRVGRAQAWDQHPSYGQSAQCKCATAQPWPGPELATPKRSGCSILGHGEVKGSPANTSCGSFPPGFQHKTLSPRSPRRRPEGTRRVTKQGGLRAAQGLGLFPSFLHRIPGDPSPKSPCPFPPTLTPPHGHLPTTWGHGLGTTSDLPHIVWSRLEGDRAGQVGGNLGRRGKEQIKDVPQGEPRSRGDGEEQPLPRR